MLPARMRTTAGWSDACILNLSSRGMMVHTNFAALNDDLVELWHGNHAITARVIWRQGPRAGLQTEDRIPVEDILTLGQSPALQLVAADQRAIDRRKRPRTHDDSRDQARAFEFATMVMIGLTLALSFAFWVGEALVQPLALIQAALGG